MNQQEYIERGKRYIREYLAQIDRHHKSWKSGTITKDEFMKRITILRAKITATRRMLED